MTKKSKPKQTNIPGTERKSIAEIDEAAEAYRDARDERMKLTEEERETHEALLEVMKRHGVTDRYVYVDDDGDELEVSVADVVKVKVRKVKNAKAKDANE